MSILKYKYCPSCGEKTYHRFINKLRCAFVACHGWQCVSCLKEKTKQRGNVVDENDISPLPA